VVNAFANGAEAEQPDNQFMFHASLGFITRLLQPRLTTTATF
jgi:hypothetical protein